MGAMYGSHTLMTYPIVNRYGVQKNQAVNIAIGGTMLTITLSLLVLAFLKSNFVYTDAITTGGLVARMVATLLVITLVFPWQAQRFFKRWTDPTSGFLIVMTMMVVSALMADWAGLEGILGAFICGASLNVLVPNLGPVMQRINFVGNNIFVPFTGLAPSAFVALYTDTAYAVCALRLANVSLSLPATGAFSK